MSVSLPSWQSRVFSLRLLLEPDFLALVEAIRRKLGTVDKSNPMGWRVNATQKGRQ